MKKMQFVLIAFLASPAFAEAPKITTGDPQFTYYQAFDPNLAKAIASTDRTFNGTMFPEGSDLKFIDLDSDKFESKLPNGKPVYEVMSVKVNDNFMRNSVNVPCMKPLVIVSRKNDPKLNTAVARAVLKNSAAIVKIN